jgi:predicted histone-like DNA-binding protein
MAMKVKAVEKLLKFDKNSAGVYRYVMSPEMYSSLNQKKVIKEAALRSGVSQGVMQACWDAAGEVIKAWATEGHSVALPGLGTMRFGLRSKSVEDVNKVKTGLITSRRIIFTPDVDLKDELKNTAIVITCYDRNGNEVKRVTSADDGTVEEPDNTTETGENDSGNTNGSNSGSGTGTVTPSGGGSQTEAVTAPTISGNTTFADTTQVSMSGPVGAEIRYTTNGSDPTAESQLYSEPFTLSDTTTVKAVAIKDGVSSQVSTSPSRAVAVTTSTDEAASAKPCLHELCRVASSVG